jgi:hypothetical protein
MIDLRISDGKLKWKGLSSKIYSFHFHGPIVLALNFTIGWGQLHFIHIDYWDV